MKDVNTLSERPRPLDHEVGETLGGVTLDLTALNVTSDYKGTVTFLGEDAGFRNTLGMYEIAEDGSIQNVSILFKNASSEGSGGDLAPGKSDIDVLFKAGTKIGFFVIPDGASSRNADWLQEGQEADVRYEFRNADGRAVDTTYTGSTYLWFIDREGTEGRISGAEKGVAWHSLGSKESGFGLNGDGKAHTVFTLNEHEGRKVLEMGFEDLWNGGDQDYDDVMFRIDIGAENVKTALPEVEAPVEKADLTIDAITAEDTSLDAGQHLEVSIDVANQGKGDALGVATTYFWSATDSFDAETAVRIYADSHGSLDAGETETGESERIRFEDLVQLGDGYIFGVVDATGDIAESDETNNVSDALGFTINAWDGQADLAIDAISAKDTSLDGGQDLFVKLTVSNDGFVDAEDTTTTLYWSATDTFDADTAVELGTDGHGRMRVGEVDDNEGLRVRHEALAELGDGYVFAVIDADESIEESDETNNVSEAMAVAVQAGGSADLTINAMAVADATLGEGQDLEVRLEVANIGDSDASGTRTTFYWSATETFDMDTAVRLDSDGHGQLNAGEVDDSEYETIDAEDLEGLGDGYLFAMIDAEGAIEESNEDNNLSGPIAITLQETQDSDLVVDNVSLSTTSLKDGEDLFVYLDVTNRGEADAGGTRTTLYWSPTQSFDDGSAVRLGSDHHGLLRAGETESEEKTRVREEVLEDLGDGFIFGRIDNGDEIVETDNGNNLSVGARFFLIDGDNAITGEDSDDMLRSGRGDDTVLGLGGNDMLLGERGDDVLDGGDGDDSLMGGIGDDRLDGGLGYDVLVGDSGADTFAFSAGAGDDVVSDFAIGIDRLEFAGVTLDDLTVADDNGNAVITWAEGTVTLMGINVTDLSASDYAFI